MLAQSLGKIVPEGIGHMADGVDAQGVGALVQPLRVSTDEIVEHLGAGVVDVRELHQIAGVVEEAMQWILVRLELLRRQVLMVGQQGAVGGIDLAVLGLIDGHRERRRAMVGDHIQHRLQALCLESGGEFGKAQARARQMFVQLVEVDAPVAVVTGLALITHHGAKDRRITAGEGFVRIVDDGRQPDRTETHVGDVISVIKQALEVAAEVADVVIQALGQARRLAVEGRVRAALIALIVGLVTIDETIGQHEVDGVAGKGSSVP